MPIPKRKLAVYLPFKSNWGNDEKALVFLGCQAWVHGKRLRIQTLVTVTLAYFYQYTRSLHHALSLSYGDLMMQYYQNPTFIHSKN